MITPRQAEILSYLTGLGPVGTWVHAKPEWLREDLEINNRQIFRQHVLGLRAQKLVAVRKAEGRHNYEYMVLRRLENGVEIGTRPAGRRRAWDWSNIYRERFYA
jgi:hypothetical protein